MTYVVLLWPRPLTFWPQYIIIHLCPPLHWSCKYGQIFRSSLKDTTLANFYYIFTDARMHRQPENIMPPRTFYQWKMHKIYDTAINFNLLMHRMHELCNMKSNNYRVCTIQYSKSVSGKPYSSQTRWSLAFWSCQSHICKINTSEFSISLNTHTEKN